MNIPRRIALMMAFLLVSPPLWAGFLGHSVGLTFESLGVVLPGDPTSPQVITDFGATTAGPGTEFVGANSFDVNVSDGSVSFLLRASGMTAMSFPFDNFYGFHLRDADSTLPNIIGVSIGFDSHFGLDPWRVTFDSDNILVNLAGMSIDTGYVGGWNPNACPNPPPGISFCSAWVDGFIFQPELVLNVVFADVPEPATAAMVGIALLALGKVRRRQGTRDQRV